MDRSLKIIVQGGRAVTGGNGREGAGAAQGGVSHAPGHHQADEDEPDPDAEQLAPVGVDEAAGDHAGEDHQEPEQDEDDAHVEGGERRLGFVRRSL